MVSQIVFVLLKLLLFNYRVYDLTNRRKFCSDWCFAASLFLANQISAAPVWSKTTEDGVPLRESTSQIQLYPKSAKGKPGDEIIMNELLYEMRELDLNEEGFQRTGSSNENNSDVNESSTYTVTEYGLNELHEEDREVIGKDQESRKKTRKVRLLGLERIAVMLQKVLQILSVAFKYQLIFQ